MKIPTKIKVNVHNHQMIVLQIYFKIH